MEHPSETLEEEVSWTLWGLDFIMREGIIEFSLYSSRYKISMVALLTALYVTNKNLTVPLNLPTPDGTGLFLGAGAHKNGIVGYLLRDDGSQGSIISRGSILDLVVAGFKVQKGSLSLFREHAKYVADARTAKSA